MNDNSDDFDFEAAFNLYKHKLPAEVRKLLEASSGKLQFFENYLKWMDEIPPLLHRLMVEQYPVLQKAVHPDVIKYMADVNRIYASQIMFGVDEVLKDQGANVDMHKKYPKLEEWRAFYGKPEEPTTLDDDSRYYGLSDEEWEKQKEEENRELKIYHEWEQKRLREFYDIIQPRLFQYLPALNELESDYWVLYAVCLRDNYEEWLTLSEHIETVVENEMPPESIHLTGEAWHKVYHPYFEKNHRRLSAERDKRIYGDKFVLNRNFRVEEH